ncbi:hypothetical protein BS47DRAFT_1377904 [Hydnum rufescens UP504]|uniref:trimethyllysine dioxygenase n=1 Tax=Hydnum rufescens UP504 TaxID=1448309 RepID=A0A9P6DN22_9AGAM|nr:hypothetical protein BS47DRAFT_1377904 [Hydnum rufescens UP504]
MVLDIPFNRLWLRDHCRCAECFHPITRQRLVDTFRVTNHWPQEVKRTDAGIEITWKEGNSDGTQHISAYPWDWLSHADNRSKVSESVEFGLTAAGKEYWTSSISRSPPTVSYEDVMVSETAVLTWLEKVYRHGFCFVSDVPPTPEDTEQLIKRIAFIRETHYGGFWDFTADLAHGDTAYTNLALKAHTDTTYYTDPCGLQIFHLLSHTEGSGGESLLVDGFRAASELKTLYPDDWEILSTTPVPTHSVGDVSYKYVLRKGHPIISSSDGEPSLIRYNNDDRSIMKTSRSDEISSWYRALVRWDSVLRSSESEYWFKLTPGTVIVIDNHRVLHGRAAFTGKRRMCGAYIGRDDYMARLLALQDQRAPPGQSVWDPML